MNSRILQKHLENTLVIYVKACANEQASDDGLVYRILTDHQLDDQSRLRYIAQIEYRLPKVPSMACRNEWSLNSRYAESDQEAEEERWQKVQKLALEFPNADQRDITRETYAQLVDVLAIN